MVSLESQNRSNHRVRGMSFQIPKKKVSTSPRLGHPVGAPLVPPLYATRERLRLFRVGRHDVGGGDGGGAVAAAAADDREQHRRGIL